MKIQRTGLALVVLAVATGVGWWTFSARTIHGLRSGESASLSQEIRQSEDGVRVSEAGSGSARRRSSAHAILQKAPFSTEATREHLFLQVSRRAIPWTELESLVDDLSTKWPKDHFESLILAIGGSKLYSVEEKSGLLMKYSPKSEGGFLRHAVLTAYLSENDMVGARALVEAMGDESPAGTMASTYYITYSKDLDKFMEVLTSDIPNENPLLGGEPRTVVSTLSSMANAMVVGKAATGDEILSAIESADIDHEFRDALLKQMRHEGVIPKDSQ